MKSTETATTPEGTTTVETTSEVKKTGDNPPARHHECSGRAGQVTPRLADEPTPLDASGFREASLFWKGGGTFRWIQHAGTKKSVDLALRLRLVTGNEVARRDARKGRGLCDPYGVTVQTSVQLRSRKTMAINAQELQGQWNKLRGHVKEHWGQLTDDDLQMQGGNIDQLVGRNPRKRTGETREAIKALPHRPDIARLVGRLPGRRGGQQLHPAGGRPASRALRRRRPVGTASVTAMSRTWCGTTRASRSRPRSESGSWPA